LFQHLLSPSAIAISAPVVFFLLYPAEKAGDDGYDRRGNEEIEKKFYHRLTPITRSIFITTTIQLWQEMMLNKV
jgi:hypothetical protein